MGVTSQFIIGTENLEGGNKFEWGQIIWLGMENFVVYGKLGLGRKIGQGRDLYSFKAPEMFLVPKKNIKSD